MRPDTATWLAKAEKSLVFAPFRLTGPAYDQDHRHAVPISIGRVDPEALAVVSYPYPSRFAGADPGFEQLAQRSFVYDDALAVLWLTHNGEVPKARRIALSLQALQRPDGCWGFSFTTQGDGFYNAGYIRAGTVAWAAYALVRYQAHSGDTAFAGTIERALLWLQGQTDSSGLVRGGRGRWIDGDTFDPDYVADFVAMEHQIDVWFLWQAVLRHDPELADRLLLATAASRMTAAIDRQLWMRDDSRYGQGAHLGVLDDISALDAAGTWAALFDIARDRRDRAEGALRYVERAHAVQVAGWPGFRPYLPGPPTTWFVEGSLARVLGWLRLGEHERAEHAFAPVVALACAGDVPLVYAPRWDTDFPLSPAAAPTLWFLLVGKELQGKGSVVWAERSW